MTEYKYRVKEGRLEVAFSRLQDAVNYFIEVAKDGVEVNLEIEGQTAVVNRSIIDDAVMKVKGLPIVTRTGVDWGR